MKELKKYWQTMYRMRFFIRHLVTIGLKNKFRRSKLGILWTFVSPLCLTIIMSVVFSTAFHYDYNDYLPYILSGILFWDLFSQTFIAGSNTIIGYDSFIRQCNHPLTLYTLSNAMLFTVSFLISMIAMAVIALLLNPVNVLIGIITLPLTAIIFLIFSWAGTTISAYIGVQYRDYPMGAQLVLQVIWYLSPVFFAEEMFESNVLVYNWFRINPVTHMLNLLREPFLYGKMASVLDYCYTIGFTAVLVLIAFRMNKKKEKNAIFYL